MSTQASIAAFDQIVDHLSRKRGIVYAAIPVEDGGATIRELCKHIGWPWPTTSARVFELAEAGLIKDVGLMRDGQTVWKRSRQDEVEELKAARQAAKKYVDAKVVDFDAVGGPTAYGPQQVCRVTVELTLAEWQRLKNTKTARFA